jgi:DnaJ like chaperone protein
MSWWGKALGGTVGFMLGGPLGALLGAFAGHQFDQRNGAEPSLAGNERMQTAFFTATFSVMGHIAKSDGRVSDDEIRLAGQVMDRFDLAPQLRDFARHLFSQGKRSDFPLDDVLNQFSHEARSRNLRRMFLEILVFAAYADQRMHPAERRILERICEHLKFSSADLAQVESLVQAELAHEFTAPGASGKASLTDAYALLGVNADDDDASIKRAYRRLMSQHHPDKLVSKGLPEEMMKLATAKTQQIKGAYEQVKTSRGMQ